MGEKAKLDPEVRDNLRAWVRYLFAKHGGTQAAFARFVGTSQPAINKALQGDIGLVTLVKLSAASNEKIDDMIRFPPPAERKQEKPGDPDAASPVAHTPRRRGLGGGSNGET